MKRINSLNEIVNATPSVVTIGVFDGVHVGHQAIMGKVRDGALRRGVKSVVITFDRNPVEAIDPGTDISYITTLDQKLGLIEKQGIDTVLVLPADGDLVKMSAEDFVADVVHGKFAAVKAVVGSNFAFGRGRAGNVKLLESLSGKYGYEVEVVQPVRRGEVTVSSTVIRSLIGAGRVEEANDMLGHHYVMLGQVVKGSGIGRDIGYPTANIKPADRQVIPSDGIYAVDACIGNEWMRAVASIGVRPTVGDGTHAIEVHVMDFAGDMYGAQIETAYLKRLRDEEKFPGVEDLKLQIARDIEESKKIGG